MTHDTDSPQPSPSLLDQLAQLSSADLRARLDALEAEARAVRTLLRSVLARERLLARRREATHA
jgi:hypothetical protein